MNQSTMEQEVNVEKLDRHDWSKNRSRAERSAGDVRLLKSDAARWSNANTKQFTQVTELQTQRRRRRRRDEVGPQIIRSLQIGTVCVSCCSMLVLH